MKAVLVIDMAAMRAAGRGRHEAEVAADRTGAGRGRGGAGEEFRELVLVKVDEEAGEREREQVGPEEAAAVDGVAPGLAHAAGDCEPARPDAMEDGREHVLRQARRLVLPLPVIAASSGGFGSLQLLLVHRAAEHTLAARTRSGAGKTCDFEILALCDRIRRRRVLVDRGFAIPDRESSWAFVEVVWAARDAET
jgi:hypothetical protein